MRKKSIPFSTFFVKKEINKDILQKMKAVAVICEYNPFHKGHEYLISEIRRVYPEYAVISVMSGASVQRGELAVYGKYYRARCAVLGGSDVVVELPFPYSCSAGEQFARAGVYIAQSLGADYLAFGSENGDLELLCSHARNIQSAEFDKTLGERARANPNMSFIRLREQVYFEMFGKALPTGGNDMLGIEYIKAINENGGVITPTCFKRKDGYSATASREAIFSENSEECRRLIPQLADMPEPHMGLKGLGQLILGSLRLGHASDDGSGIVNALISCAKRTNDFEQFLSLLPTSNYTSARLRRELIAALLGVTNETKNQRPSFTVLLGASKLGTDYLKSIRKSCTIPILTQASDMRSYPDIPKEDIELCERLESLYRLAGGDSSVTFFEKPFIMG